MSKIKITAGSGSKSQMIFNLFNLKGLNMWILLAIRVLAVLVSWHLNKSVLWAIVHYIFGVWYLIYELLQGTFADGNFMKIMESYF